MLIDSGAFDQYVDDTLIPGIRDMMSNYREVTSSRVIATAGNFELRPTATGDVTCEVKRSDGSKQTATLPIALVPGMGRHLFSSGLAKEKGISTILTADPHLRAGKVKFPLRQDGRLSKLDLKILPRNPSGDQVATTTTTTRITEMVDIGYQSPGQSQKTERDKPATDISSRAAFSACCCT